MGVPVQVQRTTSGRGHVVLPNGSTWELQQQGHPGDVWRFARHEVGGVDYVVVGDYVPDRPVSADA